MQSPDFNEDDPRWIGAWWIGPPIIGFLILSQAVPVMLFPSRLPILDSKHNTDASALGQFFSAENCVILATLCAVLVLNMDYVFTKFDLSKMCQKAGE